MIRDGRVSLSKAIEALRDASQFQSRNLQMPGEPRYQPEIAKPYLGYDQRAGWLILVEWYWLETLAEIGTMPDKDASLLTEELLSFLLNNITTTVQDAKEKEQGKPWSNHDILALLACMREYLPSVLHRWLHYCATSYDIICTAYALQAKVTFENVLVPELSGLDEIWRSEFSRTADYLQAGRTHLQTALPVTVGFWLAQIHNRFISCSRKAMMLAQEIPGKFSGAVGTSASQRVLIQSREGEKILMEMLGLPVAEISTQIAPPEGMTRYYHELFLLSGALANLGDDTRILQSSQFGEIKSASSTSSAMSHKIANPILAENIAGMHVSVIGEFIKIMLTLESNLQRDLRWSSVMRSYSAVTVFTLQQILTAKRLIKSIKVDIPKCLQNFDVDGKLVVAELLHLFLQSKGVPDAHHLVNKIIVPIAKKSGENLYEAIHNYDPEGEFASDIAMVWGLLKKEDVKDETTIIHYLELPEEYIGDAVAIARREAENKL